MSVALADTNEHLAALCIKLVALLAQHTDAEEYEWELMENLKDESV